MAELQSQSDSLVGVGSSGASNDGSPSPFPYGVFLPSGLGIDPPLRADHPTIGYKLNHFMLRIRDPKTAMHFYVDLCLALQKEQENLAY